MLLPFFRAPGAAAAAYQIAETAARHRAL